MTEARKTLSDIEAMGRIKKVMDQVDPEDKELVSRWLCDKYGVQGTAFLRSPMIYPRRPEAPTPSAPPPEPL